MIEVTVENIEKTLKEATRYSIKLTKEADAIVRKYAKIIAKKAKNNVPVGPTGNLKASIAPKYFSKEGPAATVFSRGAKGHHRHLIEYGTDNRVQKKTGRYTGNVKPKPFMKPAHDSVEPQYLEEIRKVVEKDVSI